MSYFSAYSESVPQDRDQLIRIGFLVQAQREAHSSKFGVDLALREIHTKEPAHGLVELHPRPYRFDLKTTRPKLQVTLFRDIRLSGLVPVYEVTLYLSLELDMGLGGTSHQSTEPYVAARQPTSRYPAVQRKEWVFVTREHRGHSVYLDSVHS